MKATVLAGSGMLALKNTTPSAWAAPASAAGMPYAALGRTGVQVSKIGLGCATLGRNEVAAEEAVRIVDKAIDEGINYIDTAPNYTKGQSERRVGEALKGKRDKVFLVSKTESETYEGTWKLLEQSLKHLQTDYLDLVHLHNLGDTKRWSDLDMAFGDKGAMGALREARKKGMVRYIGASGHLHPSRFHYAIDSGEIDVLMNAVNYVIQHTYDFEHKIWTRALDKKIALVSMKVFGGRQQGGFRLPMEDYENALRYTLSLKGLSTAVIGIANVEQLDQLLKTFRRVDALSPMEFIEVAQRGLELLKANPKLRAAHGWPLT